MNKNNLKQWAPFIIAVAIGLVVAIYYVMSGRSNLELNVRELEKASTVENVSIPDDTKVVVKCKNGESYEIIFKKNQTDYQGLVYDKCGEEGALETSTQQ